MGRFADALEKLADQIQREDALAKPTLDDIRKVNPKMADAIERGIAKQLKPRPAPDGRSERMKYKPFEKPETKPKESKLEIRFEQQLRCQQIEPWERNYFFLPNRDLELDFAWPAHKIGVEINGGAHRTSMKILDRDCEKLSLGVLADWRILPLGRDLVRSERGIRLLRELLLR